MNLHTQESDNTIIAKVGEHKIYLNQFVERYTSYLLATSIQDNAAVRQAILNSMISEILLRYYDDNQAIFSNTEYQKELAWVEKQAVLAYLKDREIYAKIKVSDQEIRQAFVRVNEKIAASHLYAPSLEEAENLHRLLMDGVDWDYLAGIVFTDSLLRNNGGYLGYFTWGDMDPSFEEAAYSMKPGEISRPIKTEYGYSIIRVENRISHPLLTENEFQTKRSQLERVLQIKKKPEYEKKYVESIFDESKFSMNNKSLDNIAAVLGYSDINKTENSYQPNSGQTCAEYSGRKFTEQFVIDQIIQVPHYHRHKINSVTRLKQAIKGIVIQTLLISEAEKKGYNKNNEVTDVADKLKMQLFLKYKMEHIFANTSASELELLEYFKNNSAQFRTPNELSIQEIILDNKSLADSLMNLLQNENDFGQLARSFSLREFSKMNDGIIDYAPLSKFGFLKSTFWNSEAGKIIGPIEMKGAYGIFKILGKKNGIQQKFEDVSKNVIESMYKNDFNIKLRENYLQKIRNKVSVDVNQTVINELNILEKK